MRVLEYTEGATGYEEGSVNMGWMARGKS